MKKVLLTHFTLCVFLSVILINCGTIKIPCERIENGIKITEYVIVQRHPEKQYQQFVKSTDANIKATINVLEKVKIADLDLGTKTKVTELRDKLDQFGSRQQDIIKGSYDAMQTRPCDKDVAKAHSDLLAAIAKENSALEKLRLDLTKLSSAGHFGGVDDNKVNQLLATYERTSTAKLIQK